MKPSRPVRTMALTETTNCVLCHQPMPAGAVANMNGEGFWHRRLCSEQNSLPIPA